MCRVTNIPGPRLLNLVALINHGAVKSVSTNFQNVHEGVSPMLRTSVESEDHKAGRATWVNLQDECLPPNMKNVEEVIPTRI